MKKHEWVHTKSGRFHCENCGEKFRCTNTQFEIHRIVCKSDSINDEEPVSKEIEQDEYINCEEDTSKTEAKESAMKGSVSKLLSLKSSDRRHPEEDSELQNAIRSILLCSHEDPK